MCSACSACGAETKRRRSRCSGAPSIIRLRTPDFRRIEVPALTSAAATLHLERAWTHYHLGNLEDAMGAVHALEAPSYRDLHAPEIYLLRALIYRDLCHYVQSKRVLRSFHRRYEETLRNIHERAELGKDPVLRRAALARGQLARLAAFRSMIEEESVRVRALEGDAELPLREHLARIYRLKARQVDIQIGALLEQQAQEVAEELIDFEEQMQLLDYELGLAIYQRVRAPREDRRYLEPPEHEAVFRFGEEYWNDELDRFRFVLEDRCVRKGSAK
jgi:hypothetical protein